MNAPDGPTNGPHIYSVPVVEEIEPAQVAMTRERVVKSLLVLPAQAPDADSRPSSAA